ncbi:MAG: redoxin domain-containing protein [Pirellulales bacterium]
MAKTWWTALVLSGAVVLGTGCGPSKPAGENEVSEDLTPPKVDMSTPGGQSDGAAAPGAGSGAAEPTEKAPPFPTEPPPTSGPEGSAPASPAGNQSSDNGSSGNGSSPVPTALVSQQKTAADKATDTDASQEAVKKEEAGKAEAGNEEVAKEEAPVPADPAAMTDEQWMSKVQEAIQAGEPKKDFSEVIKLVEHVKDLPNASPERVAQAMIIYSGVANVKRLANVTEGVESHLQNSLALAVRLMSGTVPNVPDRYRQAAAMLALNDLSKLGSVPEGVNVVDLVNKAIDAGWEEFDSLEEPVWQGLLEKNPELKSAMDTGRQKALDRHLATLEREMAEFKSFEFNFDLAGTQAGQQLKLADMKGKVVVVDLWGTWCPPCRAEIPHFVRLQERFGPKGLQIVGLAFENEEGEAAVKTVNEFMLQEKFNYPCALGTEDVMKQVPNAEGFPTTVFVDRQGKVRMVMVGYQSALRLEAAVTKLLAEPAAVN